LSSPFAGYSPNLKKKRDFKKERTISFSHRREHVGIRHDQPQVDVDGRHDPGFQLELPELHGLDLVEAEDESLELGGLPRGGLFFFFHVSRVIREGGECWVFGASLPL
jgi:hypothetical protein